MDDEAKEILSRSLVHQIERLTAELAAERERATKAECHISELSRELDAERERADRISASADEKTEVMRERADKWEKRAINAAEEVCDLHIQLAAAKIEIEKQRARVIKWVNAAMRNEEYDDDGR